jgi:hypothetical protein
MLTAPVRMSAPSLQLNGNESLPLSDADRVAIHGSLRRYTAHYRTPEE